METNVSTLPESDRVSAVLPPKREMGASFSTLPESGGVSAPLPLRREMGASFSSLPQSGRVSAPLPLRREMGASFSSLPESGRVFSVPPPKISRVIAFHSSARWRVYFEASKQSNKLIVIDFSAAWCRPCRYMDPTINEFAAKYADVDFAKIDVDELMDVAREFGIQAMPTFLLMKRGKEVDEVVGAKKEDLQRKIEKHRET